MIIKSKYDLGDIVYLKTDPEQHRRMIIKISQTIAGNIIYTIALGDYATEQYPQELSKEKKLF